MAVPINPKNETMSDIKRRSLLKMSTKTAYVGKPPVKCFATFHVFLFVSLYMGTVTRNRRGNLNATHNLF